jgi:hypothetical protein
VRFIVDLVVQVLSVVIARWRCTRCHHVFTDLPSFLLPHRRYASVSLMPLAQAYLESDQRSYQSIVAPQGRVMGYATPAGQPKIDERALHRSTLWRFLRFLGSQTAALEEGLRLWNQWDPGSTLHRFTGAVAPHKYRGEHRQQILRTAQRLLKLIDRWDRTFGESFFPRFATRPRGP